MKPQLRGEDRAEVRYRALPWGSTPGRNRRGQAARSRQLEVFRDGAEATVQDRRVSSPGRPAQEGTPGPRVQVGIAAALARPQRFWGSGSTGEVSLPAPYLLLATRLLLAGSARGRPGKGRGGEVRTRTSERPARPAEPQASGEQHKAASPEPPHPAAAAPRPALAPGGRRATCTGPSPPAALTSSLARGRRPQPARGLDRGGESPLQPAAVAPHQLSSSL